MMQSFFRNMRLVLSLVCASALLLDLTKHNASATEPSAGAFSVGIGVDYATGKFGTDTKTDFITIPLTIDYQPTAKLDFELVIPYVYQSNSSTVYGATMPYRSQNQTSTALIATGQQFAAGRFGSGQGGGGSDSSQIGLGDLTLTAGYELLAEDTFSPQIRGTGYLKIPTADRNKGLGTGEFDYGPGLTLDKWFGDLHLFTEGRYIFQGESDLYDTKDYVSYTAGVGYQLVSDVYAALAVNGATKPATDSSELIEGQFKFKWRFMSKTTLEGNISRGFTDGSPDYGIDLAVFQHF